MPLSTGLCRLDPHWGSTIYGLIFLVGQGLAALCFSIIMLTVVTRYEPYAEIVKPMQFHDIGKLTLAFVMLFAYFSFSQWLIIWSGNLPDEISWYLQRIRGYWGYIILAIVLFHFALPFAMLLSRDLKRAGRRLVPLALLLMFMRLVDIYWYVIPNFKHVVYSVSGTSSRPSAWAVCGWRTSSTTCGSGRCYRHTIRKCRLFLHQRHEH